MCVGVFAIAKEAPEQAPSPLQLTSPCNPYLQALPAAHSHLGNLHKSSADERNASGGRQAAGRKPYYWSRSRFNTHRSVTIPSSLAHDLRCLLTGRAITPSCIFHKEYFGQVSDMTYSSQANIAGRALVDC